MVRNIVGYVWAERVRGPGDRMGGQVDGEAVGVRSKGGEGSLEFLWVTLNEYLKHGGGDSFQLPN